MKTALHSQNQRYHAKIRFKERFGIELNKHLRRKMVSMIENNELIVLDRIKNEIKYYLRYKNQEIVIVFDTINKNIVTCLYYKEYIEGRYDRTTKTFSRKLLQDLQRIIGRRLNKDEKVLLKDSVIKRISQIRDLVSVEDLVKQSSSYLNKGKEN